MSLTFITNPSSIDPKESQRSTNEVSFFDNLSYNSAWKRDFTIYLIPASSLRSSLRYACQQLLCGFRYVSLLTRPFWFSPPLALWNRYLYSPICEARPLFRLEMHDISFCGRKPHWRIRWDGLLSVHYFYLLMVPFLCNNPSRKLIEFIIWIHRSCSIIDVLVATEKGVSYVGV